MNTTNCEKKTEFLTGMEEINLCVLIFTIVLSLLAVITLLVMLDSHDPVILVIQGSR